MIRSILWLVPFIFYTGLSFAQPALPPGFIPQILWANRPSPVTPGLWRTFTDADCDGVASATATVCRSDGSQWVATGGSGLFSGDAGDVPFIPAGNLASTNVQAALEELDSEKQDNLTAGIDYLAPDGDGSQLTNLGNAATATVLASNPTDCASGAYAKAIDAGANLTCDILIVSSGSDPTVNDDTGDGYIVGTMWFTATKIWQALDVTLTAAQWKQIYPTVESDPGITGGAADTVVKFTAASSIGQSNITDDGTTITLNGDVEIGDCTTNCAANDYSAISGTKTYTWPNKTGTVAVGDPTLTQRGISFSIGAPGSTALTAAATTTSYVTVPFACTISAWNLLVDAADTITVKFWKVASGTAIPTSSNSINTSGVSISTGSAVHSTTMTDFTSTAVTANAVMAMNVTAVGGTAAYVNGVLQCDQ
jgi:hypothetical protein